MASCERPDDTVEPDNQNVPEGCVDLGLLWAKCNLGATTPEGYGDYYAWGETRTKGEYSWATYTYGDYDSETSNYTMYKYNISADYGTVDDKTVLEAVDAAATQALGNGARIPTEAEWQELLDNTTEEWTTMNGINGLKFTAVNGNSVFLPAAGDRGGSELYYGAGEGGFYWSSSFGGSYPSSAWGRYFYSDGQGVDYYSRCYGYYVCAVRSDSQN